jgi:hypothetical protein
MARYINADLIKEKLQRTIINGQTAFINNVLIGLLDKAQTEDVQEVKHGKWKKHTDDGDCDYIECSACGKEFYPPNNEFTFDVIPKYCQNCGAKMGGVHNG